MGGVLQRGAGVSVRGILQSKKGKGKGGKGALPGNCSEQGGEPSKNHFCAVVPVWIKKNE